MTRPLTSHRVSRYGALSRRRAGTRLEWSRRFWLVAQILDSRRSVGRGHPLRQLARLHASSLARKTATARASLSLREHAAYEGAVTLLPTGSAAAAARSAATVARRPVVCAPA